MPRCDHSESEETGTYGAPGGMPVSRCLKCDSYFDDGDLTLHASMDAAEAAGAQKDGWTTRYADRLAERGYHVVPRPAHLELPHACTEASPGYPRHDIAIEMIVVSEEVVEAMRWAIERTR